MQASSNTEIKLKGEIKRQSGLKNHEAKVGDFNKMNMIRAWKAMAAAGLTDVLSDMIWDYVSNPLGATYAHFDSDCIGVVSTIGPYTSKKTGKVSPAHFTDNGSYLGSVAKMGPHPVSYTGYFRINKNDFALVLDEMAGLTDEIQTGAIAVQISCDEMIGKLFVPKKRDATSHTEDSDSDDDIPIGQLKRK